MSTTLPLFSAAPPAAFHQCWYPVALAAELAPGALVGREFLGTRIVAYRDDKGRAVVQSAWCPHLGADLGVGQVIEGRIRCAYHHWRFDGSGACVDIPAGDKIPRGTRLVTYPSAEAWGLVWAFNGLETASAPPAIPETEETELVIEATAGPVRPVDPWVPASNGVDFQHLRSLHGLAITTPPAMEIGAHGLDFTIATPHYRQRGRVAGTNCFAQRLTANGADMFMLFAGSALARGKTRSYRAIGVRRGPNAMPELAALRALVDKLVAEDAPVLDTIRFRKGMLVPSDVHLARFFHYVEAFPAAPPPDYA